MGWNADVRPEALLVFTAVVFKCHSLPLSLPLPLPLSPLFPFSLLSLSPSFLSFLPVSHGSFINLKQRTYVLRDIDMVHLFSHFLKTY